MTNSLSGACVELFGENIFCNNCNIFSTITTKSPISFLTSFAIFCILNFSENYIVVHLGHRCFYKFQFKICRRTFMGRGVGSLLLSLGGKTSTYTLWVPCGEPCRPTLSITTVSNTVGFARRRSVAGTLAASAKRARFWLELRLPGLRLPNARLK